MNTANINPKPAPTAAEIRLVNGARVIIVAFVTILIAFAAVLTCYAWMNRGADASKPLPFPSADIIGILGAFTGVIGTLVGSYFSISSANGARDATTAQAKAVNDVAQHMVSQLPPDAQKRVRDG